MLLLMKLMFSQGLDRFLKPQLRRSGMSPVVVVLNRVGVCAGAVKTSRNNGKLARKQ